MNNKEYEQIRDQLTKAARYHAHGKLDTAEIDDVVSETILKHLENPQERIEHPKTYWSNAIKNRIRNILRQRAQRKTRQIDNSEVRGLESALASGKQKRLPEKSALDLLAEDHPEKLKVIERCVVCISELYRLKKESNLAKNLVIPFNAHINILIKAKAEIDKLRAPAPLPPIVSLDEVRDWVYYRKNGKNSSRRLEKEAHKLDQRRSQILATKGFQDAPLLSDFILASIPRLRANPAMLLLRIFYKMFRIGSRKYGDRKLVRKIMLELKTQKMGTLYEPLFDSITEATNFETLRKKIYWKAKHPFYDRLASEIYSLCSESPPH